MPINPRLLSALSALCALCVSAACRPAPPAEKPEKVVEVFFGNLFLAPFGGAPDSARLVQLRPFLSDTLAALLVAADSTRAADIARAPNEKPAWVDGDLFGSLFEGASGFYLQYGVADGAGYKVPVVKQYQPKPGDPRTVWTDTAVVVAQRGKWVVDDGIFGGGWDFAQKGGLRQALEH
jgi:hypothetical protein